MTKLVSNNNANNNDYDEILETCLDAVGRGQATIESCVQQFPEFKELGDLLKTAVALHEMPYPVMADAFTAQTQRQLQDQLRARVQAQAARAARSESARQSVSAAPRWSWRRLLFRVGAVAILLAVLTVTGGGLIRASENAVRGDPLYKIKRAVESVNLTFSSEQTRPAVLLRIAEARVEEISKLTSFKRVTEDDLKEMRDSVNLAIVSYESDPAQQIRLREQAIKVVNNARASGAVSANIASDTVTGIISNSASAATATAIVQTSSTVRAPTQAPVQTATAIPAQPSGAPTSTTPPTLPSNPTSGVAVPPAPTHTLIGVPLSPPPPLPTLVTTAQISTNSPPTQGAVTSAATEVATVAPTDSAVTQQPTQQATSAATLPATEPVTNPATEVGTVLATVAVTPAGTPPATLEATPDGTIPATAAPTSVATEAPTADTTAEVTVIATNSATSSATEATGPTAVSELPTLPPGTEAATSPATEAATEPAIEAFTATRTPTKTRTQTRTRTSTRTPTNTPAPTLTPLPTSTPVPTFTPIPDIPGLPPTSLKQQPQTGVFNGCAPEGTGGDPVANVLRNRTDEGNFQPVPFEVLLGAPWPQEAAKKPHAEWPQSARDLADRVEGLPVMIEGYIAQVQPKGAELANCNSGSDVNYQIWLVAAPEGRGDFTGSIIMQITPRVRASRPGWSIEKLVTLATAGTRVRLSGWVVLDADHPEDVRKTRGTLWEIHPVMQFAVAKDGQWIRLEDYQP